MDHCLDCLRWERLSDWTQLPQLIVTGATDCRYVIGHGESAVQGDAEVADSVRHRDVSWYDWDNTDVDLVQQLTGSEPHHVRLRCVKPQSTATEPVVDIGGSCGVGLGRDRDCLWVRLSCTTARTSTGATAWRRCTLSLGQRPASDSWLLSLCFATWTMKCTFIYAVHSPKSGVW